MIELRPVTDADAAPVADLVGRLYSELSNGASAGQDRTRAVADILKRTDRCFGFLAIAGGVEIGVAMATEGVAIFAGGAYGQITELYVAPAFRSRGVASLLVRRVAELGRERGWRRIDVGAPRQPEWQRSVQFYLREGFVEVGPRLKLDL
ncbi:GNAT family N-acetyltransferase [Burkholderia sp. Ac-20379]|uniref:GNAT family N-acetyltransferase n=1 Tax=Burkholderia sp. Ac-20379 TaxID=2703900 RepID=UPI00197D5EFA|nr:GNAT family N-acetyltransferase [Burkholderia sp. Ac-20379]MBN3726806.1 GNAT family N-acetyltransferase [Burkholderia sp. Ac-20379]